MSVCGDNSGVCMYVCARVLVTCDSGDDGVCVVECIQIDSIFKKV